VSIIQTFMGRTGGRVNLTNRTIPNNVNGLQGMQFRITGELNVTQAGTPLFAQNIPGEWFTEVDGTSPFVGENYELRVTTVSGVDIPSYPMGEWRRLNVDLQPAGFALESSVYLVEIRPFGGTTILASATYTMTT
jgi:hypothetical protein